MYGRQLNHEGNQAVDAPFAKSDIGGQKKMIGLNQERPLSSKVTRASFQDSNIFNYKDSSNPTWQDTAKRDKGVAIRQNNTFKSSVFAAETHNEPMPQRQIKNYAHKQSTVTSGGAAGLGGQTSAYRDQMRSHYGEPAPF